jgi:hypothetical protein
VSKSRPVNNFVVYAYSRKGKDNFGRLGTFYYIGKGRPERPYSYKRVIKRPKEKSRIHILHSGLDEKTAFAYEIKLISLYGRIDLNPEWGVLRNLTKGGEGASGFSQQVLDKFSGKNSPNYTKRNWCHVEIGFVGGVSSSELANMYPEHGLLESSLSSLANGKRNSHKGWVFIDDFLVAWDQTEKELQKIFTPEYAKGVIELGEQQRLDNLRKGKDHFMYVLRDWCHVEHGLVRNKSNCDLIAEYPQYNLVTSNLSALVYGKLHSHRGWIYIKPGEIDENLTEDQLRRAFSPEYAKEVILKAKENAVKMISGSNNKKRISRSWCNSSVGFISEKSASELVSEYPELGLDYKALCLVATGKRQYHKGTIFIAESEIDRSLEGEVLCEIFSKEYAFNVIEVMKEKINKDVQGANNSSAKPGDWYHPVHGTFKNTLASEIISLFPDQKYQTSGLSCVRTGKIKSYRGWTLLKNIFTENTD